MAFRLIGAAGNYDNERNILLPETFVLELGYKYNRDGSHGFFLTCGIDLPAVLYVWGNIY
jgi:hypothetical protein